MSWVPSWYDYRQPAETMVEQGISKARDSLWYAKEAITDAAETARQKVPEVVTQGSQSIMNWISTSGMLYRCFAITCLLQFVCGWLPQLFTNFDKHYHLLGCLNFMFITLYTFFTSYAHNMRQIIMTSIVCLWSIRLGGYLLVRDKQKGNANITATKNKPLIQFLFWAAQACWVFITMLPVIFVNSSYYYQPNKTYYHVGKYSIPSITNLFKSDQYTYAFDMTILNSLDYIGFTLSIIGLIIESIADYQKYQFTKNNEQGFIKTGLWKYSRHPNYLGEILMWCGIYLSSCNVLSSWQNIAILSPIFVIFAITAFTGIPLNEEQANRKFGELPEYQNYKKRTPVLIPFVI